MTIGHDDNTKAKLSIYKGGVHLDTEETDFTADEETGNFYDNDLHIEWNPFGLEIRKSPSSGILFSVDYNIDIKYVSVAAERQKIWWYFPISTYLHCITGLTLSMQNT